MDARHVAERRNPDNRPLPLVYVNAIGRSLGQRSKYRSVERVILRCLEKESRERPKSAHAVAAALPGGDPLAAALAAGETPSPELMAEVGVRQGLAPIRAIGLALLAVLLIPGLLDNADQTDGLVARANSDAHEFTAAEISQARRDVIATLALAADVLERSRENTVVDVFGARLPRVINGSLRSPISDAHGTTDNHKTAPTGGNG